MAWAKVDDGWWCHPKVMGVSLTARGLWVSALSWSCAQRRDVVPATFLAMVGGSNDEAKELAAAGLWVADEAGWRIHDWAEYQGMSLSEKRAEAGRKGGKASGEARRQAPNEPRQGEATEATDRSKRQAKAEAGTHPVPTHPKTHTRESDEPEPALTLVEPPGSSTDVDGAFDEWWSSYPRKVDKAKARTAYRTAVTKGPKATRPTPDTLAAALALQRAAWRRENRPTDKIPHATTWLNGRRWEDEDLTAREADGPQVHSEAWMRRRPGGAS